MFTEAKVFRADANKNVKIISGKIYEKVPTEREKFTLLNIHVSH
jgi:hypothetical protein